MITSFVLMEVQQKVTLDGYTENLHDKDFLATEMHEE